MNIGNELQLFEFLEADNTENVARKKQRQKFVRNVNFSTKTHNLREGLKLLLKRPIKPTDLSTEINVTGYSMWKFMTTSIMDVAPDTPAAHFRNLHVCKRIIVEHIIELLKHIFVAC
ncbi:uncharacterized protein ACR2FA_010589 [Aphomia sociella]